MVAIEPRVGARSAFTDEDRERLARLVRRLFTKRRKTLRGALGDHAWPDGVDPRRRPEALSVGQLVALSRVVA